MKRFTMLICLYKKDVYNSPTIQSILNNEFIHNEFQIYIWDNSPTCLSGEDLNLLEDKFTGFIYRHCPSNEILSKLYNKVIDEISMNKGYLILCDDDSQLPSQYFKEVIEKTKLNPGINLFLPKIISDSRVISPAKDYLLFTKFIKNLLPGITKSKYMTAINSGMVISNNVFRDGMRYDERLNFYCTDIYFMNQYALHYEMLFVLNVEILHDISFNTSIDINNKLRIFKETKRANKIIYKADIKKRYVIMLNNFIVSLKLCLKFKTFKFLYD